MYPNLTSQPNAAATIAAVAAGTMSPAEACEAAIARVEAQDGPINAVVIRDFDRARAVSAELTANGPTPGQRLFGLPMTVKESFDVAGLPTSWGIPEHAGNIATHDAVVVQRLKAAGAVILGKTNVPPFLADWQAANPIYGRTNNPHDAARVPGGSSGGAAAALASGMVAAEFGSDIGGSIRVPAHFSGVWGHKPTWGVIPSKGQEFPGTSGHEMALAVVGPLARSAEDLALLFEVTVDAPLPANPKPIAGARFLYIADHPLCPVSSAVRGPIEAAVAAIEEAGGLVQRSSPLLPDLAGQFPQYMRMMQVSLFRGAPGPQGQIATAAQWFDMLDDQTRAQAAWAALFEAFDFVLMAPASIPAFAHDERDVAARSWDIDGRSAGAEAVLAYAGAATFPGLPSTVLPVGAADHLPVGLQVIGPQRTDRDCIAMAGHIGRLLHQ
jgi:amidase